jgi:phosphotransferase system IIB component
MDSEKFNEQINNIKRSFFSVLDDFKKYYVYYNKNPEVEEFQNFYANSTSQLQSLNSDMFLLTNNIQKNIQDLSSKMTIISMKLDDEKKLNEQLTKLMNNIQTTQNGSVIMIDDAKEEYNIQYYKNLQLFIGILILIKLSFTFFTPK